MWWTNYRASVTGNVLKKVTCECCGAHYSYQITRQVQGEASSLIGLDNAGAQERAQVSADTQLRNELEASVELVPCPQCGWVQHDMLALARLKYREWMKGLGVLALLAAALVIAFVFVKNWFFDGFAGFRPAINWTVPSIWAGGLAAMGFALIVGRFLLSLRYDPNSGHQRLRQGIDSGTIKEPVDASEGERTSAQAAIPKDRVAAEEEELGPSKFFGALAGYTIAAMVAIAFSSVLFLEEGKFKPEVGGPLILILGLIGAKLGISWAVRRQTSKDSDSWSESFQAMVIVLFCALSAALTMIAQFLFDFGKRM
jgi:hypothetical protein